MNISHIQAHCKAELAQAMVSWRTATITPDPLLISPWLAMSLLQKSIRRGEVGFALAAAAALFRDDPDRLWRRLINIAFEDVGLGDLDAVSLTLGAMAGKRFRSTIGGEWAVASFLVQRLAFARKCRSADDLLMTLQVHPRYAEVRDKLVGNSVPQLVQHSIIENDPVSAGIALCYALGTNRWFPENLSMQRGDPDFVFECLLNAGYPHCVIELGLDGFNRVREPLSALMSLLSFSCPQPNELSEKDDDILPTVMVGRVPNWCLDQYVRVGKGALRRFLAHDSRTSRWIRTNVNANDQLKFFGGLVFRLDGGVMRRRMQWEHGLSLRHAMDVEANGCGVQDATEALSLLCEDIGLLNRERSHV